MDMVKETLKVHPIKRPVIYQPPKSDKLYVRHERGSVLLYFGGSILRMNTIVSHRLGLTIGRLVPKLEPDAIIELVVSGESLKMEPQVAIKVAGAILKKTDEADDYQLSQTRRVV